MVLSSTGPTKARSGRITSYNVCYTKLLRLDLQDIANGLVAAEDQGTWVRNWQWGLGQAIRVVVDLAKAEAEFLLTREHCRIRLAQLARNNFV